MQRTWCSPCTAAFSTRPAKAATSCNAAATCGALLVAITRHKLHNQIQFNACAKRAVGRDRHLGSPQGLADMQALLISQEPSPVEAVVLAEETEQLMRGLNPVHRRMLELRLQGYTLDEIAVATQRGLLTTRRVLALIKKQLEQRQRIGATRS
jgi:DNA-directed RNA polymerase specialized sigma24 family protein